MRLPGTDGIFSAVKRKFGVGENCVSRSVDGLEAEGYQRLWIYDYINQGAKEEVKMKNHG
jgi:phosphoribosylaminoimidazole (AIR) synthetase